MKVKIKKLSNGGEMRYFWCPGCDEIHGINEGWGFNGDVEKPTFTPSVLSNKNYPESRCHLFVKDGQVQYLSDCFHKLAGQTVPLPDVPEWLRNEE